MIQKRTADVGSVNVTAVSFSSIFQVGDAEFATPVTKAILVQQPAAVFFSHLEPNFDDFAIFSMEAKQLQNKNHVTKTTHQQHKNIHVGKVNVVGVSSSSIFQIGSLDYAATDARILHIRRPFIL